jgi:flavin-dependent dehydrogenase
VLDRTLFDKELSASAILSGSQISIETRAIGLHSGKVLVERGGQKAIIPATVIIGADGVHSSIARWIGQPSVKTIVALQYEIVLPEPQNHVDIFFHKDYDGGYGWLFPKGRTANVGIGVTPSKASLLPELMNQFLNRLMGSKRIFGIHILGKTGGSVPCEPYQQTVFGNILLAGDAAGHAHPITGAGILNAVIGGEIAGRVASEAVDRRDLRYLENYEMEWREILGKSLSYGVCKREFLEESWSRAETNFDELIRKTWVTFKEYYEDRRKR